MASELSTELTSLVKWSVARLGWVLKQELGPASYHRIEKIRKRMASLRHQEIDSTKKVLSKLLVEMEQLVPEKRHEIARAFTLMLELINACENAYRTHRLKQKNIPFESGTTEKIYLVLTAHPTEARSPANIEIFHQIQTVLIHALKTGLSESQAELDSLLEIAWKTPIVRLKKPLVRDEAEHLYSIVLRHENLSVLLDLNLAYIPVLIRSWVGGDKDGHPGVNPSTLVESLQLSRQHLLGYLNAQIHEVDQWSNLFPNQDFRTCFKEFQRQTKVLAHVRENDGEQLRTLKRQFVKLDHFLGRQFHSVHKSILRIRALFEVFPGLVIPLELREDSTILTAAKKAETLAIFKMLKKVRAIAGQQDPCWYARGFIISMTQTAEHLMLANRIAKKATGGYRIPIVPLFETKKDLIEAPLVVEKIFRDAKFRKIVRSSWNDSFEVMVGYSDSAKDAGVLPSRLVISSAMLKIETVCKRHHVRVVFFQGSGGSVDRGGGPIQDQMAGWGKSAVQTYKATLQGEMVERTFAHPDIFKSQVYKIAGVCWEKNANVRGLRGIEKLSQRIEAHYRLTLSHDYFIDMIQKVTPYSFLSALKMGSRPTKRTGTLLVSALRAIPWILCWTQTRVLFPTWWGVGTAWSASSTIEKREVRKAYHSQATFRAYVHALSFTLAKVELAVWETYLQNSKLDLKQKEYFLKLFRKEFRNTKKFIKDITGKSNLLWYRPWLGKSIELRATMIHPLNLLEILAQKDNDLPLLRVCVTGIASGMMTTG